MEKAEANGNCDWNYLTVYDGSTSTDPRLENVCSTLDSPVAIETKTNHAAVELAVRDLKTAPRLTIRYRFLPYDNRDYGK